MKDSEWDSLEVGVTSGLVGGVGLLLCPNDGSSGSGTLWEMDLGLWLAALCLQSGLDPVTGRRGGAV